VLHDFDLTLRRKDRKDRTSLAFLASLRENRELLRLVSPSTSHGAIVAREYGIPAVMDVRGITAALSTGQLVQVDGSRGRVQLVMTGGLGDWVTFELVSRLLVSQSPSQPIAQSPSHLPDPDDR
jgi:hypothetical protein